MKHLFIGLALVLGLVGMPNTSFSATLSAINSAQFQLNRVTPQIAFKHQLGLMLQKARVHSIKCVYDFTKQGGAVGALNLIDLLGQPCSLPKTAIIRDVLIDVVTAPTSGGSATIAIGSGQAANDLKAATAIASYTGLVAGVPVGTAATAIKLTADRTMSVTIATAALTAGKLNVHVQYQISE